MNAGDHLIEFGRKRWYILAAAAGVVGCYFFFSWRESVADRKLIEAQQQASARQAQLASQNTSLHQQNQDLAGSNRLLSSENERLQASVTSLRKEAALIKSAGEARIQSIQNIPPTLLPQETSKVLSVSPATIQQLPDGISMTDATARVNLIQLIQGQTAAQQLDLAGKEAVALQLQVDNLGQEIRQCNQIVTNKDQEIANGAESCKLSLGVKDAEIRVIKARVRKRNVIWAVAGVAGGAVLTAMLTR